MPIANADLDLDGVPIVRLESQALRVDVAPSIGGRVVSLIEKSGGYEFMWRNKSLRLESLPSGTEYDPNFYGGIDELLPNDIPESINGVDCPDHGELWTTALNWSHEGGALKLDGVLPKFGLRYERWMSLRNDRPILDLKYRLTNLTSESRNFLWKLHAALNVQEGDIVECPAATGQIADPRWSRFTQTEPFPWPMLDGVAVNEIPAKNNTMDFFYLSELKAGRMSWRRPKAGLKFTYEFDTAVFPFAWFFASYGGFLDHYTAIIEPCTAVPISVNDALVRGTCTTLGAGQQLDTAVTIYAGRDKVASATSAS